MKKFISIALGLILLSACNSAPVKEFSDADVEYIQKSNTWIQKVDGTTIKENFVVTDELLYDVPHRREVKVDENGVVISSDLFRGSIKIQHGDFTKAPHETWFTLYPSHPDNQSGGILYMQRLITSSGYTVYIKDANKATVGEILYDNNGNILKSYDWENGKRVVHLADLLIPEKMNIGYERNYDSFGLSPVVEFKLRNKSGKRIDESVINLFYEFIKDDEIIDSNHELLSTAGGWEDNICQQVRIRCLKRLYGDEYGNVTLRVVIKFKDGSVLYDGPVPNKIINSFY